MPAHALKTIARNLGARILGDGEIMVERLVHPSDARGKTDLVLAYDKNLHALLDNIQAGAVVVSEGQDDIAHKFKGALVVNRPRYAMAKLTALFASPPGTAPGVHPSAVVDPGAKLGKNVSVGPLCFIDADAEIGDGTVLVSQVTIGASARIGTDCLFHSGVRIGSHVTIGARCIAHFNAAIGSDGFSFVTPEAGSTESAKAGFAVAEVTSFNKEIVRIHSLGAVTLGDDVEIGACTTIDRGTVTDTRIGNGTKIDNQVQIGHNARIGENCLLCGMSGMAGSAVIGNRVVLAARSGVGDHVRVGDDVILLATSQAGSNLPEKAVYLGTPAVPKMRQVEQYVLISRLKSLFARTVTLEEKVNSLEKGSKKS